MLSLSLSSIANETKQKCIFIKFSNKWRNKQSNPSLQQSLSITCITITLLIVFAITIKQCNGHGRLIEPPSRSSAWRFGFQTPPNYNDESINCGGIERRQRNDGKCGVCSDAWDETEPRPNEYGGTFGRGVVVRQYKVGSEITLKVELTYNHMGYFEFRICPNVNATQECFDRYLLELINASSSTSIPHLNDLSTSFYPRNGNDTYEIKGKLPDDLTCSNCVLQWRYITDIDWGTCPDGREADGCGPIVEFRACADINIGDVGLMPTLQSFHNETESTTSQSINSTVGWTWTSKPYKKRPYEEYTIALGVIVVCVWGAHYVYNNHKRIRRFLFRN